MCTHIYIYMYMNVYDINKFIVCARFEETKGCIKGAFERMICDDMCGIKATFQLLGVSNDCHPLHCQVRLRRPELRHQPPAVWQNWSLSLTSLTCLTCLTPNLFSFMSFPSLVLMPSATRACQMFHRFLLA